MSNRKEAIVPIVNVALAKITGTYTATFLLSAEGELFFPVGSNDAVKTAIAAVGPQLVESLKGDSVMIVVNAKEGEYDIVVSKMAAESMAAPKATGCELSKHALA